MSTAVQLSSQHIRKFTLAFTLVYLQNKIHIYLLTLLAKFARTRKHARTHTHQRPVVHDGQPRCQTLLLIFLIIAYGIPYLAHVTSSCII